MSKKDKKRIAELERDSRILSGKILNLQRNFELLFKDVKQEQARADIAVSQRFEALNMHFGIFKAGTISSQTSKGSPTRDGAKLDFEQVDFVRLGRDFSKSGLGMLKSMFEGQDKTKCAGCQNIENVLNKSTLDKLKQVEPKQDKTYMCSGEAQIRNAMANVRSVEPFKSDDDSKYMSDFQVALRYAMLGISKSEQPEAEPTQGSDGADSPKTYDTIFDKPEQGLPKPTRENRIKIALENLVDDLKKHLNFTLSNDGYDRTHQIEMLQIYCDHFKQDADNLRRSILGEKILKEAGQSGNKQPEINHYDRTKATLNKIVLGRIEEMEKWLGERENSTNEIAKYIQVCVDNLGLDLADFRRKVLDLGRVEPCKVDLRNSELGEVEPKETDQTEAEKDGEKQGEADGADSPTWKVWIVKTNPNYSDRVAPFYLEYVDKNNVVCHKPNAKDAMKFPTELEAKSFLNKLISDCSARYIPDNFGLRELDSNGIVTPKY